MRIRFLTVVCLASAAATLRPRKPSRPAQTKQANWQPPKTSWGHPIFRVPILAMTCRECPSNVPRNIGTRRFLTEQELAERAASVDRQKSAIDTGEPRRRAFGPACRSRKVEAAAVPANFVEYARRASALTSLVSTRPTDASPRSPIKHGRAGTQLHQPASTIYLDMTIYDRWHHTRSHRRLLPGHLRQRLAFIQTPDMIAIRYEMVHETRLIPLDNRPRTKNRSYMGEPRGTGKQHPCGRDHQLHRRETLHQRPAL